MLDQVTAHVALLLAMSLSTERAVEIVKGLVPWLYKDSLDPNSKSEAVRKVAIHAIAVACGGLTAYLSKDYLPEDLERPAGSFTGALAFGLLLSGGSGLWNSILTYLVGIKDLKRVDAEREFKKLRAEPGGSTTSN
jgi:hypothetical protein